MTGIQEKLKLASKFEEEKKFLHALQIYQKLYNSSGGKSIAVIKLALLYEKMDQKEKSFDTLSKFLEVNSSDQRVRKFFIQFLIKYGKYSDAVEEANFFDLEKEPMIYMLIGLANYYLEDYSLAMLNFESYIDSKENELLSEAYFYIGSCYLKTGKYDSAMKFIKKSEAIYSLNPELHLVKGMIYFHKKMLFHSLDAIQKAEALDSRSTMIKEWKSRILYELGELDKAKESLKDLIENYKLKSENFSLLGIIYIKTKNYSEAEKCFAKALKLNPEDKTAAQGLAECKELIENNGLENEGERTSSGRPSEGETDT